LSLGLHSTTDAAVQAEDEEGGVSVGL
jgi:hypothetical protein